MRGSGARASTLPGREPLLVLALLATIALLGSGGVGGGARAGIAAEDPPPDVPLPQPLGAISDYGAQLGRSTRAQLQALIAQIEERAGVRVYVLITLLDPFGSPSALVEAIWDAWALEAQGKAVLLLFVREGEPWAFRWRSHPELGPKLRTPEALALWAEVEALVGDRKVAQAVRTAVEGLHRALGGLPSPGPGGEGKGKEEETPPEGAGPVRAIPIWVYALGGGLGVLGLLAGAVAYALVWLCPGCGARLARNPLRPYGVWPGPTGRGGRRVWVYYCRRCGYRRVGSGGERGRGPRRL